MPNAIPFSRGKPYTIAMVGENDAEINLYGEVVSSHPVDWWTGERLPGDFIALDELLRDLDELNSKDNVTVHIHSVGGDFYAGLAIYNRLRTLKANITTINDGLAASAGSLIFMAGDPGKRKVHAASNLMIHGVLSFLYGYYNAVDLKAEVKTIESHNKAAIAAYAEATGLSEDVIKAAMSKDTYMTGQEAVDAGWASEVISDDKAEPITMKLSPDKSCLMVNGYSVAARCMGKLPESIPQMTAEEWAKLSTPNNVSTLPENRVGDNTQETGGKDMEIKNIDGLRSAYPEFVAQIETAARAEGAQTERQRIQGIESIQTAIGDTDMIRNAKFGEKPMNAQELAFAAMQKQANLGADMLGKLDRDAQNSGASAVAAKPAEIETPKLTDDEQAVNLMLGAIPEHLKKEDK